MATDPSIIFHLQNPLQVAQQAQEVSNLGYQGQNLQAEGRNIPIQGGMQQAQTGLVQQQAQGAALQNQMTQEDLNDGQVIRAGQLKIAQGTATDAAGKPIQAGDISKLPGLIQGLVQPKNYSAVVKNSLETQTAFENLDEKHYANIKAGFDSLAGLANDVLSQPPEQR